MVLQKTQLTISLLASRGLALADFARLLEINVPCFFLVLGVLQLEGEDGFALVDGVFSLGFARGKGSIDGFKGLGGREGFCMHEYESCQRAWSKVTLLWGNAGLTVLQRHYVDGDLSTWVGRVYWIQGTMKHRNVEGQDFGIDDGLVVRRPWDY